LYHEKIKPLISRQDSFSKDGWTLDVLRVVQLLGKMQFSNDDVYEFVPHLERLHPENRHVRDKVRQQLQVLRDRKFLVQVERGVWAVARDPSINSG
jgi:type II restriction enzyme